VFGLCVLSLLALVYLTPGLAVLPRAWFDSRLAFAVPVLSVLVVTTIGRLLEAAGIFDAVFVMLTSVILALVAVVRIRRLRGRVSVHWPVAHRWVYAFSVAACLPVATRLGMAGFDLNDEIYSWNLWAIQHLSGIDHDLYYTRAPYPQTFSFLIAWCYQLLGSIDLQLPVKASFAVLTAALTAAIGVSHRDASSGLVPFAALAVFLLYVTDAYKTLSTGLAEVLMIPALVVAVALYFQHRRNAEDPVFIWLAAGAAVLAGLSKQPALLWLMLVMPVLVVADVRRLVLPPSRLIPVALAVAVGLLWLLTEGSGFLDNQGVVRASREERSVLDQLLFASMRYLEEAPALLLLLVASGWSVFVNREGRGTFSLFVVPALLMWLLFGAYNYRLGVHVAAIAALLIAVNDYRLGFSTDRLQLPARGPVVVLLALICVAVVYAIVDVRKRLAEQPPGFSSLDGPANAIRLYFEADAHFVLGEVFRSEALVWAPSNYLYGLFYGHNPVIRPPSDLTPGQLERVRGQLLEERPEYVFATSDLVAYGAGNGLLRDLLLRCPDAFEEVVSVPSRYGYTGYRVRYDRLDHGACP
jgi:hypothetical protein